jgi:thioredoxin-dependent peroxiredoxin
MATLAIGKTAPEIKLPDANGKTQKLSDFRGRKVVLYFYPKDNTSGCTTQACGFRDHKAKFDAAVAVIIGISPDNEKSHQRFIEKFDLPFTLLCDTEHEAATAYGVWKEKSMYGRKYMGIERSTFIIDEQGILIEEHRKVKVAGHVEQMLAAVE